MALGAGRFERDLSLRARPIVAPPGDGHWAGFPVSQGKDLQVDRPRSRLIDRWTSDGKIDRQADRSREEAAWHCTALHKLKPPAFLEG